MNSDNKNHDDHPLYEKTINNDLQLKNNDNIDNHEGIYAPTDLQTPLPPTIEDVSIYNIRTNLRRNIILVIISLVAFILPLCDTMYLPAIETVKSSLNTSDALVVVSVQIFLFVSGIGCLIWGPVADRFGRKIAIVIALIIFLLTSVGCIFSPDIGVLIGLRAIEGGAASATLVVGQSFVADIYPEEQRGRATGIFFLPFNTGAIVGPLIGGPLSQSFGWRSTFVFLSIFSCVATVVFIIFVPETHHYLIQERFHKENPNKRIIDASLNQKVPFGRVWKSLFRLLDLTTVPYIIVASTTFSALYINLTVFAIYLHKPPYNYSNTIIGALYAPSGVATLLGSLLSGWISDKASKLYGNEKFPEGRLIPAMIISILIPIGLLIYGWTFHYQLNAAIPIVGQVLISFSQAILEPTISAYLTIKKYEQTAAVSALNMFFNFCTVGFIISFTVPMNNAMGTGPYFSLISGINVAAIAFASIVMHKRLRTGYIPL